MNLKHLRIRIHSYLKKNLSKYPINCFAFPINFRVLANLHYSLANVNKLFDFPAGPNVVGNEKDKRFRSALLKQFA